LGYPVHVQLVHRSLDQPLAEIIKLEKGSSIVANSTTDMPRYVLQSVCMSVFSQEKVTRNQMTLDRKKEAHRFGVEMSK